MKPIALTLAACLAFAPAVFAADNPPEAPKEDPQLTERIRTLISMLVGPNANLRKVAERQLIDIGEPVVPILTDIMNRSADLGIQARGRVVLAEIPNAVTLKKLRALTFAEINFKGAELAAVVDFISDESVRIDFEKRGINFVLKDNAAAKRIEALRLRNIPLYDALKVITDLADCEFVVENGIVVIRAKKPTTAQP
jgi:hypothetical protein